MVPQRVEAVPERTAKPKNPRIDKGRYRSGLVEAKGKEMSEDICECGHLKSEHLDCMWVKPEKEGGRTYRRWVAKGQGMCSKCSCAEFKKKE